MKKVRILVIGAGNRGHKYSQYAKQYPERLEIIGVAEPRDDYRNIMVNEFKLSSEHTFNTWQEAVRKDKFADAVIIATQDKDHLEPALAFAKKNYHILLEKPMATTPEECQAIYNAVNSRKLLFGVCHVLRYTPYTQKIKEILNSGKIGEIITMQRIEPVGFWHYAHSYARGNWRNEKEASFMLLAKSCHDIDWIHYIVGKKCTAVSSFGSLKHFKKENQPEGASDRCLDCNIEKECPYSAKKIYIDFDESKNENGWPSNVLTTDTTHEGVMKAIKEGPYGRCVYACDNDVVDNQIVSMQFEDGSTASFIMTAFSEKDDGRRTTIFGTKGEIRGNGCDKIEVYDFLTRKIESYNVNPEILGSSGGHGGGDFGLMEHFVNAVANNNPDLILSGPEETLNSHLLTFYAEQSRLEGNVIYTDND